MASCVNKLMILLFKTYVSTGNKKAPGRVARRVQKSTPRIEGRSVIGDDRNLSQRKLSKHALQTYLIILDKESKTTSILKYVDKLIILLFRSFETAFSGKGR